MAFAALPFLAPQLSNWFLQQEVLAAVLGAGVVMRLLQYPAALRPQLYTIGSYMGVRSSPRWSSSR